jgi:hypothetical protein
MKGIDMTSEMIDSLNKFIQISRLVNDYQLEILN